MFGTHFNVNAYADEPEMSATLLEGSVKITKGNQSKLLEPGQQAVIDKANGDVHVKNGVDLAEAVAWKNGFFIFRRMDIRSIMRQVGRWYDVSAEYKGEVKSHFTASIERDVPVSKLLGLLEGTGDVHLTVEGKKIIVNP